MARKIINVGVADKGNGDPIRVAFSKANDNFAELYNILSNNTGGSIITTDVIGSVFADDSTLLVDGINGRIPYSVLSGAPTIPAAQVQSNWTATNGMGVILNKPTLFSGSYTDLTNKPTIPTSFSSLVNGASTVSLASTGALTIPGDIRSEGNINIDINLADSTLRRWQFGEDGALTLPSVGKINNGAYDWTFGSTGSLTLPLGGTISEGGGLTGAIKLTPAGGANANQALLIYPTAAADGDHVHLTAGGGSTELYIGNDLHYVKLVNGGNVEVKATTANASASAAWTFGTDGLLYLPNGAILRNTLNNAIAFGQGAGTNPQGAEAVAIGINAGYELQGTNAIAIGTFAGETDQGEKAVAIGDSAGYINQGDYAVAIGHGAGNGTQGSYAVAIGTFAGQTNQAANSIIINASGVGIDNAAAGFYVKPVRQGDTANAVYYNSSTGEITYSDTFSFSVAADDSTQRLISNNESIKFIGAGKINTASDTEGNITITGADSEGSWTVTTGTNTYSFTVPMDGTYVMWVKGNIPNGIITWNATLSISNTNVPAIGYQYAWNYTGGGTPISLTSIPNQIKGTAGTISTDATYAGSTSNRFDFGISNTSGASQTVYYGYTRV